MSAGAGSDLVDVVLTELTDVVARVSRAELGGLAGRLDAGERVFVAGEGRSGFTARAFAMRLMHLGLCVHVVGESTTPSIGAGDVVVGLSASGTTASTLRVAEQAVTAGATVHAVTADPGSPLAGRAEVVVTVPATTDRAAGRGETVQLLSSLFDQAAYVVLDVVCLDLAHGRGVDDAAAKDRHADT